jgi:MFS family permease
MKLRKFIDKIRAHPLIDLLFTLQGNPKVLVLVEPFCGVPFNLIAPFTTLYMYALGITDVQIGLILSISMVSQLLFSFTGGIVTDKIGRKKATLLGDFGGWTIACLVWAFSQNFWWFSVAVIINGFEQLNQTAWTCLWVEETPETHILGMYTWFTICGLVAVFFAPISGILIDKYTLVPVMRVLYTGFAVTMAVKAYITLRYTTETRRGKIRIKETKNISAWKLMLEYGNLVPHIFKNRATMGTLVIMVVLFITNLVSGSFFGLYVHTRLGIDEQMIAMFPIIRAIVMLIFLFAIQYKFQGASLKIPMQAGLGLYIISMLLLIFASSGKILPIALYILLEAVANALVMPRKDSLVAMNVEPEERARIVALLVTFMVVFASPFGYLAGLFSSIDRRLPFVFCIALFLLAIVVLGRLKEREPEKILAEQ